MLTVDVMGKKKLGVRLKRIIAGQLKIATEYPSVQSLHVYRRDYEALARKVIEAMPEEERKGVKLADVRLTVCGRVLCPTDDEES